MSTFWDDAWQNAQPALSSIRASVKDWPQASQRILRVGQLDAELLDQELLNTLKEPVNKALGQIQSVFETRYDPEVALVIGALLYKLSMWDQGATYGAKLQELRYSTKPFPPSRSLTPSGIPRKILLLHAGITVIIPYLHKRTRIHALSRAWPDAPSSDPKRKAWNLLTRLETLHSTLGLAGFLVFLWDGKYRTIADRVLGLRLVPVRPIVSRNVSYEFMNRQMVWHSFTEFLLFLLPFINTRSFRRRLSRILGALNPLALIARLFSLLRISSTTSSSKPDSSTENGVSKRTGKYWTLPETECAICHERNNMSLNPASTSLSDPLANAVSESFSTATRASGSSSIHLVTTPYRTVPCGHVYCYFCLSERIIQFAVDEDADVSSKGVQKSGWECLRCGEEVTGCERVTGVQGDDDDDGISERGSLATEDEVDGRVL